MQISDVTHNYNQQIILDNISSTCAAGRLLAVMGANGSGKSTLLRICAGLIRPAEGTVTFKQRNVLDNSVQCELLYIGHKNGLDPNFTVYENLQFYQALYQSTQNLHNLLEIFNLHYKAQLFTKDLSCGEKRKVALLRMLLSKASVWLLDEPLANLDKVAIKVVWQLLAQHLRQGGSVLLSSHQNIPLSCERIIL